MGPLFTKKDVVECEDTFAKIFRRIIFMNEYTLDDLMLRIKTLEPTYTEEDLKIIGDSVISNKLSYERFSSLMRFFEDYSVTYNKENPVVIISSYNKFDDNIFLFKDTITKDMSVLEGEFHNGRYILTDKEDCGGQSLKVWANVSKDKSILIGYADLLNDVSIRAVKNIVIALSKAYGGDVSTLELFKQMPVNIYHNFDKDQSEFNDAVVNYHKFKNCIKKIEEDFIPSFNSQLKNLHEQVMTSEPKDLALLTKNYLILKDFAADVGIKRTSTMKHLMTEIEKSIKQI